MGYTHYWRMQDKISKSNWKKIKDDFERLVEVNEWKNILSSTGNDKLIINDDMILFNGIENNGHEWFILYRKLDSEQLSYQNRLYGSDDTLNFFFCKTARKPYDICAVTLLIIMKKYLGEKIKISSDGENSDWYEGVAMCQDILGYNKFKFSEEVTDSYGTSYHLAEIKPNSVSIKSKFSEREVMRMANIFTRRLLSNGLDFYGKRDKVILEKIRKMITENGEILVGFKKQDRGLGGFDKERRSKWIANGIANEVEEN